MKLTVALVVYKQNLQNSKTYQTMLSTGLLHHCKDGNVQVVVYDNSPEPQEVPAAHENLIVYKHDSRNVGIATAYNAAWEIAKEHGSEWLVLLDHDTKLTGEYVASLLSLENRKHESVAAVVPKMYCNDVMISPVFSGSVRPLQGEQPTSGTQNNPVMAINSGSAIRMTFLTEIGGFNEEFPLDYLDHWLFHEIYKQGYKVFVLAVSLNHELSVMNYKTVSLWRYQSIVDSETRFYKGYQQNLLSRYKKQLLLRGVKQLVTVRNKQIALYTFRQLRKI